MSRIHSGSEPVPLLDGLMFQLFELLRLVEDIRLAPEVLEPDPVDIAGTIIYTI